MNKLVAMASSAPISMARALYSVLTGTTFGGARDFYEVFGWNREPTHAQYVGKYLRQDIAGRVINSYPDAIWTDPPIVEGPSRYVTRWNSIVAKYPVYPTLRKLDIFAGLGQYACLLIGINDGQPLTTPVNTNTKQHDIIFLQPYLEGSVDIVEYDESPFSARFGLPTKYRFKPQETTQGRNASQTTIIRGRSRQAFEVHWSRVLHVADNTLENIVFGHSRLKPIYNALDDILKIAGGSAETYWLTANRGLQVDIDKDLELDSEDADALSDEIEEYEHGLRRILRTRGVKVNALGSDVADPRGVFNVLVSLIAANTKIPQRVLIGAEAGQLASQQDRANWAVAVEEKRANWTDPHVLRPFMAHLESMNVLPQGPGNITNAEKVTLNWPEPFKMSPLERGQTSAQQARSATNIARAMDTAQKGQFDLLSVEEARQMIAPSTQLLELTGTPTGTLPPKFSAPVADPENAIKEAEATAAAATATAAADPPNENGNTSTPPPTQTPPAGRTSRPNS